MNTEPARILITGDFCPINRIEDLALRNNFSLIYNDFIDVLHGSDLNIVDLECPLTESEFRRPKIGPHQKAHPVCIDIMKYGSIHLVAMANNHIMDYGSEGVVDTIKLCKDNDINTVGIGRTPKDAGVPFSVNIKGKKVGILNFADDEFITTPDGLFTCNPIDHVQCFYDIQDASNNHDHTIVIIHAGNEFYNLPSPRLKKLYRYLIDLGADAVISHHTHTFSGYEVYKNKPIFYGLGNFIYDAPEKMNSDWNKGYAVNLLLHEDIDFEIFPYRQCNDQPGLSLMNVEETEAFQKQIERLNLIIQDECQLEFEYQKYCNSVFKMYDSFIEPYFGKYINALRNRGLFPNFLSTKKRLLLLNLVRCESHRDVLVELLKQYK